MNINDVISGQVKSLQHIVRNAEAALLSLQRVCPNTHEAGVCGVCGFTTAAAESLAAAATTSGFIQRLAALEDRIERALTSADKPVAAPEPARPTRRRPKTHKPKPALMTLEATLKRSDLVPAAFSPYSRLYDTRFHMMAVTAACCGVPKDPLHPRDRSQLQESPFCFRDNHGIGDALQQVRIQILGRHEAGLGMHSNTAQLIRLSDGAGTASWSGGNAEPVSINNAEYQALFSLMTWPGLPWLYRDHIWMSTTPVKLADLAGHAPGSVSTGLADALRRISKRSRDADLKPILWNADSGKGSGLTMEAQPLRLETESAKVWLYMIQARIDGNALPFVYGAPPNLVNCKRLLLAVPD